MLSVLSSSQKNFPPIQLIDDKNHELKMKDRK
jgi:hypothetical protein